jgi:hypothetical protein
VRYVLNLCICLSLLGTFTAGAARQCGEGKAPGEQFLGTWSGTWEGVGSTGGFELTLEKPKDASMAGRVSVTGEPTYKATIKTLTFDGPKLTAKYDFPPDENIEILLNATFDGNTCKGTWTARGKAGGADLADGTWTVTRK